MSDVGSKMYIVFHARYPTFVYDFNKNWLYSTDLRKILKYIISRKSVGWESSCSTQTGRNTDMTKLIDCVRNFANAIYKSNHSVDSISTATRSFKIRRTISNGKQQMPSYSSTSEIRDLYCAFRRDILILLWQQQDNCKLHYHYDISSGLCRWNTRLPL